MLPKTLEQMSMAEYRQFCLSMPLPEPEDLSTRIFRMTIYTATLLCLIIAALQSLA